MVDRDIVFNLEHKTLEIFSDSACSLNPEEDEKVRRELPLYSGGD